MSTPQFPSIAGLEPGDAALVLARTGVRVGPFWPMKRGHCTCELASHCDRPGRHPISKPGFCPRGVEDYSTNLRKVRHWWGIYPTAGLDWIPRDEDDSDPDEDWIDEIGGRP